MIKCAFWSSFSRRVFSRSSLRTFSSSGLRSRLRPRFFDSAFRDPLCAALRHVVRCDEYDPQLVRRSEPPAQRYLSPPAVGVGQPLRAPCTGPLLRRSAACTTERTAGAAAYLPPPSPQELPRFAYRPRLVGLFHSLSFSLGVSASSVSLPSPYSNSLAAPCLT